MNPSLLSFFTELGIAEDLVITRGLREHNEAAGLEIAEVGIDGRKHLLIPPAAKAWRELKAAANSDGISLFIISAFRSISRQVDIIRRKLESGVSIDEILTVCAPPGFSEHHTGCAIDLSAPGCRTLEEDFGRTPAFEWLHAHAGKYSYFLSYPINNQWGYKYEPWHWCFKNT